MNIPHTRVIRTEKRCELTADDGHHIVAVRYVSGFWAILNEFSSKPEQPYHFSLRKQFSDSLNGR